MTLYWRPRPADCIPDPTPRELWIELRDLIREREQEHAAERVEWMRALLVLIELHAGELAEAEAGHAAALEALAHSEALAQEGAAALALEKIMEAVVTFEARAKRDPAGAARALCRWLERMRGSAEKGKAA